MSRRPWRHRRVIIGAVIVALSVGIVFASLPYLQPAPERVSITIPEYVPVAGGNLTYPYFNALKLPNMTVRQTFYVGISVNIGTAKFCAMEYQLYESWAPSYNQTRSPAFPWSDCVTQTGEISQATLNFSPTSSGTWVVVALNSNTFQITVTFTPA